MTIPQIYRRLINASKRRLNITSTYWTEFPSVIHIDTTNRCGPKHCGIYCSYCYPQWAVLTGKDQYGDMPIETIEWILKEIAKDGRKSMSFLCVFWSGDALAENRLPEILRLCKKVNPWLKTQTFTCGTLTEKAESLLDKNLDEVCFTISAHNRELYKRVHRGDKFDNAIATLKTVLEKKHAGKKVEVHLVLTKDNYMYAQDWWRFFGKEEFTGVKRIISPLVDSVDNLPSQNVMTGLSLDEQERIILDVAGEEGRMWIRDLIPEKKPCVTWDDLTVHWTGTIMQCCNWADFKSWNYGTIQDLIASGNSLKDVWMERLANRMRNRLCMSCNMKHPSWKARLDNMKIKVEVAKK